MGDRDEIDAVRGRIEGVRALARRLIRDASTADDAVQDAIVAALDHPRGLAGVSDAWLRRVVRHRLIDGRRAKAARRERERDRAIAASDEGRGASESAERHRELASLVLDLTEPYRSTITMRYFDDLSPREIAARTGRTPAAVKKQIHRGLEMLRTRLRERYGDDRSWAIVLLPVAGAKRLGRRLAAGPMLGLAAAGALLVGGTAIALKGRAPHRSSVDDLPTAAAVTAADTSVAGAAASSMAPVPHRTARTAVTEPTLRAGAADVADADVVTIRGRFIDERGEPIVGAVATWLDPKTEFGGVTGADGELELRCPPWSVEVAVLGVEDGVHAPARFDWRGVPSDLEIDLGDQKLYDPAIVDVQVVRDAHGPEARGWTVTASHRPIHPMRSRTHQSDSIDLRTRTATLERVSPGIVRLTAVHDSGARAVSKDVILVRGQNRRFELRYSGPDPAQRIGVRFVTAVKRLPAGIDPATIRLEQRGRTVATAQGVGLTRLRFDDVVDRPHVVSFDDPRFEPRRIENVRPGSTVEIELVDRR